jgi:hypothetical protein
MKFLRKFFVVMKSSKSGFTVPEVTMAAAIMLVVALGTSQLMVTGQRSITQADAVLTSVDLEKNVTNMAQSEAARCNSVKAGSSAWRCINRCLACESGDSANCASSGNNCRNHTDCGAGAKKLTGLKDHKSAVDSRTGADGLAGWSIMTLIGAGNKVTDSGTPCGGTYASASSACRWRVKAEFQPDYNDAMRFTYTITYEPNEADDKNKVPPRSWDVVVPMSEVCTSL